MSLEHFLSEAGTKIAECKAAVEHATNHVANLGEEATDDVRKVVDEAKEKFETAKQKFEQIANAAEDDWEHLKEGVENAFTDLKQSLAAAKEKTS